MGWGRLRSLTAEDGRAVLRGQAEHQSRGRAALARDLSSTTSVRRAPSPNSAVKRCF